MTNIVSLLKNKSIRHPTEIAYLFLETGEHATAQITYEELDKKACAIAAHLQSKNLFAERVLLLYPTGLDFIAAFMGCLYAGVIAVPVLAPNVAEFEKISPFIDSIKNDANIAGILTIPSYIAQLKSDEIFVTDTTSLNLDIAEMYQLPKLSDDTIAYLQYTSGSTSTPKAVVTQHQHLMHSLKYTAKAWSYKKKSITLTWAPHSHVYGLVCGLLIPLYQGSLGIIMPPSAFVQHPRRWLKAITRYKVTHSGGPNFGYDLCIKDINEEDLVDVNLKTWKVAINGGENVQPETLEIFSKKFANYGFHLKRFCSAYGMSELTGAIAVTRYTKKPYPLNLCRKNLKNNKAVVAKKNNSSRTFVTNGYLLPGLHVAIVNPYTLMPVERGEIGEIWLSGKSLSSGYWQREEETAAVFGAKLPKSNHSYFRTGDLGFIKKKELCLTGRFKDLIVLYGKKHYPLDLEITGLHALKDYSISHSNVAFSMSIQNKEEVIFLQEINDGVSDSIQNEIIAALRQALSNQHQIDVHAIFLVKAGSLPKTASGKLQRKLCQLQFAEKKVEVIKKYFKNSDFNSKNNKTSTQSEFIQHISSILNISVNEIDLNYPLSQYGFDSITLIKLANLLNETYQLAISPAVLYEYSTLGEFYNDFLDKPNKTINAFHEPQSITDNVNEKDIAIIGMSGVFPEAENLDIFWNNLVQGKDTIKEIPADRWNWQEYYGDAQLEENKTKIKWGGFIENIAQFDAHFFNISTREAELIDPQQRLFLQIAWKAIEDAGYTTDALSHIKTGLFVGVFTNDYAELLQKNQITDAYTTTGLTHSILANRVSFLLNLNGPSEAIDTACSSSLVAIHHAVVAIQNGDCEVAIVGGVNALLSPTPYIAASKAGMLSEDGRCKTFDIKANGYVRGEGVAAILLKPLHKAKADGDHVYGIIKGTAVNHGGHVSSLTVPNPIAQADVIVTACRRASISIESISYIETHGTGTSLGDPIEINGLKKAFHILKNGKNKLNKHACGLGSVKTHVGHLEAAAGIAGVIKVLLAMKHEKIPANLNFEKLNPYIDLSDSPFYIVDQLKSWDKVQDKNNKIIPRRAGVSSFGFGGTNAHIILEEPESQKTSTVPSSQSYLITISAKTEDALYQRIKDLSQWIDKQKTPPVLASLSYTLNAGRNHFDKRCMMMVKSIDELQETLRLMQQDRLPDNVEINTDKINKSFSPDLSDLLLEELNAIDPFNIKVYSEKLFSLGKLYIQGHHIKWEELNYVEKKRISLPTYPFAKDNYWIPFKKLEIEEIIMPIEPVVNENKFLSAIQRDIIFHAAAILKEPVHKFNITFSLSEQGFDSISFKELAIRLEEHYDIQVNPTIFFTYNSIQGISEYLLTFSSVEKHQSKISLIPHEPIVTPLPEKIVLPSAPLVRVETHQSTEAIAIIGMQGLFPDSKDTNAFWEHLVAGDDLVTEVPIERWDWRDHFGDAKKDPTKTNSKWGAFLEEVDMFDAAFFNVSAREANLMDPQQRLMIETVWRTIEDAGYDPFALSEQSTGIFVGVEYNDYRTLIGLEHKIFHGHIATGNSHAMLANRISYFLNLNGPSEVIDTACSSSLVAIHRAVSALRSGECSLAIAGGVSILLNPDNYVITTQLGALSAAGRCKTFDKAADGYVKGEGVASILLKPLAQAQKDGDHIYAVIRGSVVNHGGKAQSLTAPNAIAQSQLLIKAYAQANINPDTVNYIEAHGTGTELGDPIEIEGLKLAFNALSVNKNARSYCGLGSVKSNIGHLEPASGVASVIKVLLAMQHAKIPGNLHFNELNPYIKLEDSPFYVINKTQPWTRLTDVTGKEIPRRAGVSSFGFGGTNAHIVLEEATSQSLKNTSSLLKPYYLITLSAKQDESLKNKIIDLYYWLKNNSSNTTLESLSYTLNTGRTHFDLRCAIVVNSLDELFISLEELIHNQQSDHCIINTIPVSMQYSPLFDEIYQASLETIKNYNTTTPQVYRAKLLLLADLYTRKYALNWTILHKDEKNKRTAGLPSYPFIKQHYWFDAELHDLDVAAKPILTAVNPSLRANIVKPDLNGFTLHYLQNIFSEKLRIPSQNININSTYEVYGIDSLIGLEITNRLEDDFGTLPKTLLYERTQIIDLAQYFQKKFPAVLLKLSMQDEYSEVSAFENVISTQQKESVLDETVKPVLSDDIAIIGLTGIYPMAKNIDEFWENLVSAKDCISEVPIERWDYKDYPVSVGGKEKYYKYGGFIPDVDKFDPLFFKIAPRDAGLMDPQERLFLQSAWEVIEDAGYTRESLKRVVNNHVGVFVGVTYNFYPLFIAEEWEKGNRLPLDIQLFSVANRVSYFLDLNGPSFVVDTACSSSLAAIHSACESIARGECTMAIAGGINLSLHPAKYHMLGGYSFLSDEGRCTSFGADGTGYVPAEGVGSVLLKPLSLAIKDNDRIYGVIKSSSMNHGGKTSGYSVPNPNAQAELIQTALTKAQIDPRSISYIEAHGTGTALGDPIEIRGLQDAFENYTQDKQFCAIGSVKSNIGHLESAAGISQLTKVLLQMRHKKLVPSLHSDVLNPFIDFSQTPFFVQHELADWQPQNDYPRRAGISSFGAGGTNIHLIVEEYISEDVQLSPHKQDYFLFVLSALNSDILQNYAQNMRDYLQSEGKKYSTIDQLDNWLSQVCYTLQVGRESMATKLLIKSYSYEDLLSKLKSYIENPQEKRSDILFNDKDHTDTADFSCLSDRDKLMHQWISGHKVSWEQLYNERQLLRIALPTYPFAKRRCWVPSQSVSIKPMIQQSLREQWLIFSDNELGFHLQDELGKGTCSFCFMGEKFEELDNNVFYINPESREDYSRLIRSILARKNTKLKGIIYLWPLEKNNLMHLNQSILQEKISSSLLLCLAMRTTFDETLTTIFLNNEVYKTLYLILNIHKNLCEEAKIISREIDQFNSKENIISYQNKMRQVVEAVPEKEPHVESMIRSVLHNREDVIVIILNKLSRLLDLEVREIDPEIPFQNYGLDSIIGINFVAELSEHYPDFISPMDLYRYPTVNLLTDYIIEAAQPPVIQEKILLVAEFDKSESQFMDDIAHLSDSEISKMLEDELMELENM